MNKFQIECANAIGGGHEELLRLAEKRLCWAQKQADATYKRFGHYGKWLSKVHFYQNRVEIEKRCLGI